MIRKLRVDSEGEFTMDGRPVDLFVRADGVVCAEYAFNPPVRIEIAPVSNQDLAARSLTENAEAMRMRHE